MVATSAGVRSPCQRAWARTCDGATANWRCPHGGAQGDLAGASECARPSARDFGALPTQDLEASLGQGRARSACTPVLADDIDLPLDRQDNDAPAGLLGRLQEGPWRSVER